MTTCPADIFKSVWSGKNSTTATYLCLSGRERDITIDVSLAAAAAFQGWAGIYWRVAIPNGATFVRVAGAYHNISGQRSDDRYINLHDPFPWTDSLNLTLNASFLPPIVNSPLPAGNYTTAIGLTYTVVDSSGSIICTGEVTFSLTCKVVEALRLLPISISASQCLSLEGVVPTAIAEGWCTEDEDFIRVVAASPLPSQCSFYQTHSVGVRLTLSEGGSWGITGSSFTSGFIGIKGSGLVWIVWANSFGGALLGSLDEQGNEIPFYLETSSLVDNFGNPVDYWDIGFSFSPYNNQFLDSISVIEGWITKEASISDSLRDDLLAYNCLPPPTPVGNPSTRCVTSVTYIGLNAQGSLIGNLPTGWNRTSGDANGVSYTVAGRHDWTNWTDSWDFEIPDGAIGLVGESSVISGGQTFISLNSYASSLPGGTQRLGISYSSGYIGVNDGTYINRVTFSWIGGSGQQCSKSLDITFVVSGTTIAPDCGVTVDNLTKTGYYQQKSISTPTVFNFSISSSSIGFVKDTITYNPSTPQFLKNVVVVAGSQAGQYIVSLELDTDKLDKESIGIGASKTYSASIKMKWSGSEGGTCSQVINFLLNVEAASSSVSPPSSGESPVFPLPVRDPGLLRNVVGKVLQAVPFRLTIYPSEVHVQADRKTGLYSGNLEVGLHLNPGPTQTYGVQVMESIVLRAQSGENTSVVYKSISGDASSTESLLTVLMQPLNWDLKTRYNYDLTNLITLINNSKKDLNVKLALSVERMSGESQISVALEKSLVLVKSGETEFVLVAARALVAAVGQEIITVTADPADTVLGSQTSRSVLNYSEEATIPQVYGIAVSSLQTLQIGSSLSLQLVSQNGPTGTESWETGETAWLMDRGISMTVGGLLQADAVKGPSQQKDIVFVVRKEVSSRSRVHAAKVIRLVIVN